MATDALWLACVVLAAVTVQAPAVAGGVKVTLPVPEVVVGLTEPQPAGATLQLTPARSLLLTLSASVCWSVSAARRGATVTVMLAGLMVIGSVVLLLCAGLPESLTVKVSAVPAAVAVGVPAIVPVAAASVRPAGRLPLLSAQESGAVPPLAVSAAEYAWPTCPFGSEDTVMFSAGGGGGGGGGGELEPPPPQLLTHNVASNTRAKASGSRRSRGASSCI